MGRPQTAGLTWGQASSAGHRPSGEGPAGTLNHRAMLVLSAGHCCTDISQSAVPALLPFLIAQRGYSIAAASALVLAVTISSSIVQPLFGHVSDRRPLTWLLPAGPILAGIGLGLSGVLASYWVVFVVILVGGIGVAAYHPEGARYANYASGEARATAMSLFSVGGNAGFALGPILVSAAVIPLGLGGTLAVAAVPLLGGLAVASQLRFLRALGDARRPRTPGPAPGIDRWDAFVRLAGVIAARSGVYFGLTTFVPLYYVQRLGQSKATGDLVLTVMLAAGAAGTLVGGPLADRFGRRPALLAATSPLAPLIAVFLLSGPMLAAILLVPIGACTIATFSVTVVMGQEFLPRRVGVASGVTLGLAVGMGGVAAALLGALANAAGLGTVMWTIAALPLVGLALTLTLPSGA